MNENSRGAIVATEVPDEVEAANAFAPGTKNSLKGALVPMMTPKTIAKNGGLANSFTIRFPVSRICKAHFFTGFFSRTMASLMAGPAMIKNPTVHNKGVQPTKYKAMYPAMTSALAAPKTSVKNTSGSVNVFPNAHAAKPKRGITSSLHSISIAAADIELLLLLALLPPPPLLFFFCNEAIVTTNLVNTTPQIVPAMTCDNAPNGNTISDWFKGVFVNVPATLVHK